MYCKICTFVAPSYWANENLTSFSWKELIGIFSTWSHRMLWKLFFHLNFFLDAYLFWKSKKSSQIISYQETLRWGLFFKMKIGSFVLNYSVSMVTKARNLWQTLQTIFDIFSVSCSCKHPAVTWRLEFYNSFNHHVIFKE